MAINQISTANTFEEWLTTTSILVAVANNLTDNTSGGFLANSSIFIEGANSSLNVRTGETVKFMCFKVKQRGISKYEFSNYDDEKTNNIGVDNKRMLKQSIRNKKKISAVAQEIDKQLDKGIIGYNWPYDYFSLVELAEIDATVEFSQFNPNPEEPPTTPIEEEEVDTSVDVDTGMNGSFTVPT